MIVYTLSGFFLVPYIAKQQIATQLTALLKKPVTVESVSFNPYTFKADINGFSITENNSAENNGDALLGFQQLRVNFQLSSVFRLAWTFREIQLSQPFGSLVVLPNGTTNFHDLIPASSEPKQEQTSTALPRLIIQRLAIVDGYIDITDLSPPQASAPSSSSVPSAAPFQTRIDSMNFDLADLSTLPNREATMRFGASSQHDTQLSWNGGIQLNPLRLEGNIASTGGHLPLAYRYFEDYLDITLTKGDVDLSLDYRVALVDGEIEASLHNGGLEISDLRIEDRQTQQQLISLPRLALRGFSLKWPQKKIAAEGLTIEAPQIFLERLPDNSFNLQHMLAQTTIDGSIERTGTVIEGNAVADKAIKDDAKETDVTKSSVEEFTGKENLANEITKSENLNPESSEIPNAEPANSAAKNEPAASAQAQEQPVWSLSLSALSIADLGLTFRDRTLSAPADLHISDLDLQAEAISNNPNTSIPLTGNMTFAGGGTLDLEATITPLPELVANANITLNDLPLVAAQPYINDVAAIAVKDGMLNLTSSIESNPNNPFAITGSLSVPDFKLDNALLASQLLGWQQLAVSEFSYSLAGNRLKLNQLKLVEPQVTLTIEKDKTTNFTELVKESSAELETETETQANSAGASSDAGKSNAIANGDKKSTPFSLAIGKISVEQGAADFSDRSLPIPFDTRIRKLNGSISPIDTADTEPATVNFEGEVDDYGHALIEGTVLAHDATSNADIRANFRNLIMPDLSPYSIAFAGREISKGRMNLDLHYLLDDGKLRGDNNIVLSDFTLGKRVEYEGAMSLPLDLALALLKDINGKIDLDLAIRGDTDDPKFSVGGIVAKALANLITKAVTAPFRLLGSLVGAGSNDVGNIEFEPGSSKLAPPEREKIARLTEALGQRPQLNIKIAGTINPDVDLRALKEQKVDQSLEAMLEKAKDLGAESRTRALESLFAETFDGNSGEAEPVESIRQQYVVVAEGSENQQPKLRRSPYNRALYDRIVEATELEGSPLDELAAARASSAINAFTVANQLPSERLETVQNPGLATEVKATKSGRIPLKLDLVPANSR